MDELSLRIQEWSYLFRGHRIPDDFKKLIEMQCTRVKNDRGRIDPLRELAVGILDPGEKTYLIDLANFDLGEPNIAATAEVFKHIVFVAENELEHVYGYWCGPNQPAGDLPIVKYDTEGQFRFPDGSILAEALLSDCDDGGRFTELKEAFAEYGIHIAASTATQLRPAEFVVRPDTMFNEIYERLSNNRR